MWCQLYVIRRIHCSTSTVIYLTKCVFCTNQSYVDYPDWWLSTYRKCDLIDSNGARHAKNMWFWFRSSGSPDDISEDSGDFWEAARLLGDFMIFIAWKYCRCEQSFLVKMLMELAPKKSKIRWLGVEKKEIEDRRDFLPGSGQIPKNVPGEAYSAFY